MSGRIDGNMTVLVVDADALTGDGSVTDLAGVAPDCPVVLLTDGDPETLDDGLIGVMRDITDRKARERALQRQNKRLEEFASIVSHDLRNPLNVAQGNLSLLERDADSEAGGALRGQRCHVRRRVTA